MNTRHSFVVEASAVDEGHILLGQFHLAQFPVHQEILVFDGEFRQFDGGIERDLKRFDDFIDHTTSRRRGTGGEAKRAMDRSPPNPARGALHQDGALRTGLEGHFTSRFEFEELGAPTVTKRSQPGAACFTASCRLVVA